jgi:pyrroline-5-carboxylate reductase
VTAPASGAAEILLVGCGKMGGALLQGWRTRGIAKHVTIVEPGAGAAALAGPRTTVLADASAIVGAMRPDVVVFAVKPQMMNEIVPQYRRFAASGAVFLSIAAGKTLGSLGRLLGAEAAVVRAMPNTPAAIGRGITVACASAAVGAGQRDLCERLLAAAGEVGWVADEALIDAVTAVSGSGPAYVFLLIECLAAAAVEAGLPLDLAMRLARATVAGAGELAWRSDEPAGALRENVTSPGGTTRAALDVLMAPDGLQALLTKAVLAAARRSRELAD